MNLLKREGHASGHPVTVLQIGEGNFLRAFFDGMLQRCRDQGLYDGGVAVTQPRPSGKAHLAKLAEQDGLFTVWTRGLEEGKTIDRTDVVSVVSRTIDPYEEWETFLALAESADLRWVVSNTTEAGLAYKAESYAEGKPVLSFPGKMAIFLYRRFVSFRGAPDAGLYFLPCELLERNGDELKRAILRYCDDWELPAPFKAWVAEHNRFLNSLVDRIVSGYPAADADAIFARLGYRDELLTTAEPYCFWAIEAEPELDAMLPLKRAGLNVEWVADLKPYQLRKVRILNGAHTMLAMNGLLRGLTYVREAMEHPAIGALAREAVEQEIVPALPMPKEELTAFAEAVYERFLNPFLAHRLHDIAMNSVSKFQSRLLPTILSYVERDKPAMPRRLAESFAALLRYYRVTRAENGYEGSALDGTPYAVRDNEDILARFAALWADAATSGETAEQTVRRLLGSSDIWGRDLSVYPDLVREVAISFERLEGEAG